MSLEVQRQVDTGFRFSFVLGQHHIFSRMAFQLPSAPDTITASSRRLPALSFVHAGTGHNTCSWHTRLPGSICQQNPSGSSSCSAPHLDACGQRAVNAVCSRRRSEGAHHHQKWCSLLYFTKRYSFAFQRLFEALSATSLSKRINAPLQIYCYTTRSR